jgi:hypothetical protein
LRLHGSTWCARGTGPISSRCGGGAQLPTQGIQTRRNRRRFARDSQKPPAEPAAVSTIPAPPAPPEVAARPEGNRHDFPAPVRRSRKLTAHHSTGPLRNWLNAPLVHHPTDLARRLVSRKMSSRASAHERSAQLVVGDSEQFSTASRRLAWKAPLSAIALLPPKMPRLPVQSEPTVMTRPRRSSAEMPQLGTDPLEPGFASDSNHTSA